MTNRFLLTLLFSSAIGLPQSFDVTSIKANAANDNRVRIEIQPSGRFKATGMSLRMLMGRPSA